MTSSIRRQNAQVFDGANGVRNRPISNISSVYEQYFDYETAAQVRERERGKGGWKANLN